MLDFRNTNTLWASVLVETLVHLGMTTAVISPGSRSTPLTVAFARHPTVDAVPMLDERSASFFALGQAKASGRGTVLVCTSGTAGANYFPAIIEAYESQVPLLVLTADRPPELRDCASGQTIDQQKLFGRYVRSYADLALPEARLPQLRYLRQRVAQAWQQCHWPMAGPVHLNCPFRDPLAPVEDGTARSLMELIDKTFFQHLSLSPNRPVAQATSTCLPADFGQTERGIIIAGPAQPLQPQAYCATLSALSRALGWPVLAEGLSPLRNWASLNSQLITTYDLLLRHAHHAQALIPEQVIQLGPLPTSKVLRQWLAQVNPLRWVMTLTGQNQDPLHGTAVTVPLSVEQLVDQLPARIRPLAAYGQDWCQREAIARQRLAQALEALPDSFEGKLSSSLPTLLPPQTPVMIANSMPVRDVEWFWPLNDVGIQPYFSRGANGIDGTLSTALGIAHHHGRAVLLTGDLALLHDSNGFLNAAQRNFHLTILLINNQGGGIFESLPIAQFEPPFEAFFATPQAIDFGALAVAHGVEYGLIEDDYTLKTALAHWPTTGVRLLEVRCDRKRDAQQRQALLAKLGEFEL